MTASLWKDRKKLKTLYNIQQNPSPTYHKKILRRFIEKLSLFIPFRRRSSGGMTVEATIVLPICIFFLLNLGSAVEMIRLHNHLQLALWDSGRRIALYGCEYSDNDVASLISAVYLKAGVTEYVGKEYLDNSPLENGSESLRFWESRMLERDKLDIRLTYAISPPVSLAGFRRFRMSNRYFVHLWNGYEIPEQRAETEVVYMAENGRVCHKDRKCTHLLLSIRRVFREELDRERNQWGSRYVPCEKCATGQLPECFYVTREGHCFHYREDCPGLKRTVLTLTPEEVQGYPYCSRCGGE